ncbi:uncharacterized protein LAJ45_09163 [Morchella importuna]|uniref:uncharacterized protein n=1 Tax=Morchella importuna TaxID=1174673 RepID=UPI001E8E665C|nr:uncharacterized protein LAJ45_09163 [Morchella importuna]KAH8146789.1 hypothetical protein LAJ45_09163 [Morchella importuna]
MSTDEDSSLTRKNHLSRIDELKTRIKTTQELYADIEGRYKDLNQKIFRTGARGHALKALPKFHRTVVTDEKKWERLMYEKAEIAGGLEDLEEVLSVLQAKMDELLVSLPARKDMLIPMRRKLSLLDLRGSGVGRLMGQQ